MDKIQIKNRINKLKKEIEKYRYAYHVLDKSLISDAALDVAQKNAKTHDVAITFFASDLFQTIPVRPYNLIVANLPYLSTGQLREPSIQKEPRRALWGGTTGTELYEAFLETIELYLSNEYCALLEIDPLQAERMQDAIHKKLPQATTIIHNDLAGLPRVVMIRSAPLDYSTGVA